MWAPPSAPAMCSHLGCGGVQGTALIHMPPPAGISEVGPLAGDVKLPGPSFPTPSPRLRERKGREEKCVKTQKHGMMVGWPCGHLDRKPVTDFNLVLESGTRSMTSMMMVLKWLSEGPGSPMRYLRGVCSGLKTFLPLPSLSRSTFPHFFVPAPWDTLPTVSAWPVSAHCSGLG